MVIQSKWREELGGIRHARVVGVHGHVWGGVIGCADGQENEWESATDGGGGRGYFQDEMETSVREVHMKQ